MTKNILKLSAFLLLAAFFTSCSGEDTTIQNDAPHSSARSSYWNGVIGVDGGGNRYQITANPALLIADFEQQLAAEGDTVQLQSLAIVKKKATNDSTDEAYMLIATDNATTSIGVMLERTAEATFKLSLSSDAGTKSVSCRGCATGCNLEYLNMPGGKVPYCNVNGCGEFCTKREISMD